MASSLGRPCAGASSVPDSRVATFSQDGSEKRPREPMGLPQAKWTSHSNPSNDEHVDAVTSTPRSHHDADTVIIPIS